MNIISIIDHACEIINDEGIGDYSYDDRLELIDEYSLRDIASTDELLDFIDEFLLCELDKIECKELSELFHKRYDYIEATLKEELLFNTLFAGVDEDVIEDMLCNVYEKYVDDMPLSDDEVYVQAYLKYNELYAKGPEYVKEHLWRATGIMHYLSPLKRFELYEFLLERGFTVVQSKDYVLGMREKDIQKKFNSVF